MKLLPRFLVLSFSLTMLSVAADEELIGEHPLQNFQKTEGWHLVTSVALDEDDPQKLSVEPNEEGKILVNATERVKGLPYLLTKQEYGDLEMSLEFLIPKGSNAGVYLMGRYEVQILDSFGKKKVGFGDLGGIYEGVKGKGLPDEERKKYAGVAPSLNAAKEPGSWQRLEMKFRAPRFSEKGEKIEDAVIEWVRVNGKVVQENVSVAGPTISHPLKGEAKKGPISIQGDHGPIAIRSFVVREVKR
ncbi:MAG: 3-keto-disaccharide hydrolase [Roseibacillus sp.]